MHIRFRRIGISRRGRKVISMPSEVASFTMAIEIIYSPAPLNNIICGYKINVAICHIFGELTIDQVELRIAVITSQVEVFEALKTTVFLRLS